LKIHKWVHPNKGGLRIFMQRNRIILELGFPVHEDDGYTHDDLAADYAVMMAEFERQLGTGECTDTANFAGSVFSFLPYPHENNALH
jgi:hypothetical protein